MLLRSRNGCVVPSRRKVDLTTEAQRWPQDYLDEVAGWPSALFFGWTPSGHEPGERPLRSLV